MHQQKSVQDIAVYETPGGLRVPNKSRYIRDFLAIKPDASFKEIADEWDRRFGTDGAISRSLYRHASSRSKIKEIAQKALSNRKQIPSETKSKRIPLAQLESLDKQLSSLVDECDTSLPEVATIIRNARKMVWRIILNDPS